MPHDCSSDALRLIPRLDRTGIARDTPKGYGTIARLDDAPQAFGNLMAVVAADTARRRKSLDGVHEAIALCESPMLMQLWTRWAERRGLHRRETPVGDSAPREG